MALNYKSPYLEPLRAAQEELRLLNAEIEQLNAEIGMRQQRKAHLEATIAALRPLTQEPQWSPATTQMGLTDACRAVLIESGGKPLTAPEVRGLLALKGIDISAYSNPMAVLHSTLKRIAKVTKAPNGETGYQIVVLDAGAIRKLAGR